MIALNIKMESVEIDRDPECYKKHFLEKWLIIQPPLTRSLFPKIKLKWTKWRLEVIKRTQMRSQVEFTIMNILGMAIMLMCAPNSKEEGKAIHVTWNDSDDFDYEESNDSNYFMGFEVALIKFLLSDRLILFCLQLIIFVNKSSQPLHIDVHAFIPKGTIRALIFFL